MIPKAKFILSKSKVLEQYGILEREGLLVSYSVKTNPIVAGILEENTKCFFSIHMQKELKFIRDKSRVWFLAESWDREQIGFLLKTGVKNFVVYNLPDLERLMEFLQSRKEKINLMLRLKLRENTIFTERYYVFGMDSKALNGKMHELRKSKNIRKLGVHFHMKSQNIGEWEIKRYLEKALDKQTLKEIDMVNIGGGLPVRYRNSGDVRIEGILEKIREAKKWLDSHGIKTIVEPGRFISAPAVRLEARIVNITGRDITVNCSVYNSALDTLIVPTKLLVEGETERGMEYLIKGYTPCSMDIFRYSARLPEKKVGDKIVFLNAGAYNFHSDFCSLEKIPTEIID